MLIICHLSLNLVPLGRGWQSFSLSLSGWVMAWKFVNRTFDECYAHCCGLLLLLYHASNLLSFFFCTHSMSTPRCPHRLCVLCLNFYRKAIIDSSISKAFSICCNFFFLLSFSHQMLPLQIDFVYDEWGHLVFDNHPSNKSISVCSHPNDEREKKNCALCATCKRCKSSWFHIFVLKTRRLWQFFRFHHRKSIFWMYVRFEHIYI